MLKVKILIVDDSSTDRMLIKNMLYDYDVLAACDGLEALQLIDNNSDIDFIILDLNMPNMDGFQLLNVLKSNEKYRNIRTIILTNYDELDKEIEGLNLGAIDFLRKPINMQSLRTRIGIHLELLNIQKSTEKKLDERNLLFETVFEQAPIGIAIMHKDTSTNRENDINTSINPMLEYIIGRTKDEMEKIRWAEITPAEDYQKEMENYNKLVCGEIDRYSMEKRYIRPDGSLVWADITASRLDLKNKSIFNHLYLVQDINERKKIECALYESERSKHVLLSNLPGLAYRCKHDREWTMQFISEGCYDLTGYKAENLLCNKDLSFNDLIAEEYRDILWIEWKRILPMRAPFRFEYEIISANGQRKWVLELGQGVYDQNGNVEALEGIIIDITDRKEQENKLKYLSEHDELTGLYNRRYLEGMLIRDFLRDNHEKGAVLLLNFNKINALSLAFGHNFSDNLVKELAANLSKLTDHNKILFKISFERYAFYIREYDKTSDLSEYCVEIFNLLKGMQILNAVGCGIGILEINKACRDTEEIMKNVSVAAEYATKDQLFKFCFFDNKLKLKVSRETEIKDELLKAALDDSNESIYLNYQPILDLKTNKIREFEALARFNSEKLGIVPPTEFIPISEEMQLIVPIGKKVLHLACNFIRKLEKAGFDNIKVSVNVSSVQLLRNEFMDDLMNIVKETHIRASNLVLEITESIFSDSYDIINVKIDKLKELGIEISIDDFGTGYSSLARLNELNVDCLKIDKCFIDNLPTIKPEESLTGIIISMAHRLGYYVVAEGVEHEKQKKDLIELNCDYMQGYFFSKPIDSKDAIKLLEKTNGKI